MNMKEHILAAILIASYDHHQEHLEKLRDRLEEDSGCWVLKGEKEHRRSMATAGNSADSRPQRFAYFLMSCRATESCKFASWD